GRPGGRELPAGGRLRRRGRGAGGQPAVRREPAPERRRPGGLRDPAPARRQRRPPPGAEGHASPPGPLLADPTGGCFLPVEGGGGLDLVHPRHLSSLDVVSYGIMWSQRNIAMKQLTVGVRELKSQLSHYLHEVKTGATVVITERGTPVGRLIPVGTSVEERLNELVATGQVAWSGRKLRPNPPTAQLRGDKTVAEMLVEDRE